MKKFVDWIPGWLKGKPAKKPMPLAQPMPPAKPFNFDIHGDCGTVIYSPCRGWSVRQAKFSQKIVCPHGGLTVVTCTRTFLCGPMGKNGSAWVWHIDPRLPHVLRHLAKNVN